MKYRKERMLGKCQKLVPQAQEKKADNWKKILWGTS